METNGGKSMANVLMVYASQTGNTEMLTDMIEHALQQLGHRVEIKSFDFDVIGIDSLTDYDAVLVGTYTWDDGELPYEVEDFYIDLEDADLTDQLFGVYGSADSFYDTYGLAIELIGDRLRNLGATMIPERLIVDLTPRKADEERCIKYAELVADKIKLEANPAV